MLARCEALIGWFSPSPGPHWLSLSAVFSPPVAPQSLSLLSESCHRPKSALMADQDQPQPLKQYLLQILQQTRRDRQHRFYKRKRKLARKKPRPLQSLQPQLTTNLQSDSECLGDSEKSDSDRSEEGECEVKVSRKQCAKTRQSLAEDQLENNRKGELVCLTCLKKFSNIQNLR